MKKLRNGVLISVAAVAMAGALGWLGWTFPAFGADLYPKAPPVPSAAFGSWTGFYGGLQAGYGWDWSGTDLTAPGAFATLGNSPHGFTGGGRLGYDVQSGPFVWGVVTDVNVAGFDSTSNMSGGISIHNVTNWWGSTNLRVGLSQFGDHVLPYVTGGAAYGGKKTDISGLSASSTSLGWNAGAGIETRITKGVSVFIEGKYIDLGSVSVPIDAATFSNQKFTFGVVEGGIHFRF